MFQRPFGHMGMLEDGRGREPRRDRDRDRPSDSRDLAPFDSDFGFRDMFTNMNSMMGRMMGDTEKAFVSLLKKKLNFINFDYIQPTY